MLNVNVYSIIYYIMARHSLSQEIAGRTISGAFFGWLKGEVISSDVEVNTYLADFDEAQRRLCLGYDNDYNWTASKDKSHLDRLPKWWEAYAEDPTNDYQSARVLFASLMFVPGAYRNQCYIQAQNAAQYGQRRSKAIGINLQRTIIDHLATVLPRSGNFSHADINLELLNTRRIKVATGVGETATKSMIDRLEAGLDLGQEKSPAVETMLDAQREWIAFATDCVALAAKIRRGELAKVPFLEPKSISADPPPKVIYPLAA